ncbi:hypothetical protein [Histidinibacterium aquaticum]|uniref:Uncharacterized protein n=1 Tax=Histidinibacterium aquaticum TaxID=2613962 RepID=A0A5J5GNQ2_9RHOB|nr:hypothetical protein [Histidinibacterium aquaticum]KAA9009198.1 hypothetical protein F3S47_08060 [Histidinibacterium aquaticum]
MDARLAALGLVAAVVLVFGSVGWSMLRAPEPPPAIPETSALCHFETYCEGADCGASPPPDFRIVRNGPYDRTYIGPADGSPGTASVTRLEGAEQISSEIGEEEGVALFGTVTLRSDGGFDYRRTRRLISSEPEATGSGTCTPFTETGPDA